MSNEVIHTINRYLRNKENSMQFFGKRETAQEVADFLSYGKTCIDDKPDMAILHNGKCLAIEHFEFDCYKNKRGGSENRKEKARVERAFQALPPSTEVSLFQDEIKGNSSYEQYINNVSATFSEHYFRIPDYKRNLVQKGLIDSGTDVKMAFLIEDVSPLGSMAYNDDGQHPIVLALSKEFLKLMRESPDIDYVIACSSVNSECFIWLVIREEIDQYETKSIDYAQMDFIDLIPQVFGYNIVIPG